MKGMGMNNYNSSVLSVGGDDLFSYAGRRAAQVFT